MAPCGRSSVIRNPPPSETSSHSLRKSSFLMPRARPAPGAWSFATKRPCFQMYAEALFSKLTKWYLAWFVDRRGTIRASKLKRTAPD
jgi:hypothetical protein